MSNKQVSKSHYDFNRYMSKGRWSSVWHQITEVCNLSPNSVLEIGPGPGIFKKIGELAGLNVKTLDIDPELNPDYLGPASNIPIGDSEFDLVCAFQMLEHMPYEESLLAFNEMVRVSSKYIVISLPDAKTVWRYSLHLPKYGLIEWLIPRPFARKKVHEFDGEHYWEINKAGYELSKVVKDLCVGVDLLTTYRIIENPYHRFFIFKKLK